MPKYIAILKNPQIKKLPNWQDKLHKAFAYLGFINVRVKYPLTHVYFEYWMKSTSALTWHIVRIVREKLKLETSVLVKKAT